MVEAAERLESGPSWLSASVSRNARRRVVAYCEIRRDDCENLPRLISGGGGALGWSRRPTDVVDVARPHERTARESDMTAAAFSAAHAAGDAAPMDLVPHAKSAGVPEKKSAADSAADAATAARDKSKNDAKHGKKSKTTKDDSKGERDDDDTRDAKLSPVERCEKRIRAAKRATRSELSVSGGEWSKNGYALNPDVLSTANLGDDVPRISAKEVSVREFRERFENPRLPCIITDAMDHWPAMKTWTYDGFLSRFGNQKFKVGADDDGYAVRLKFAHIYHYVTCTNENSPGKVTAESDDSPLYIFDGSFGDKDGSKPLLDDYDVPAYFKEDLFGVAGEKRRPPYRWVVIGPPRSGSSVHIDPLATSAWNALISGKKRWCLFPPTRGLTKPDLKPKGIGLDGESVTWFRKMYPRTRSHEWRFEKNFPTPLDVVQNPGEIMYVPDGWWHAVLNLEHTVAVTQNVVGSGRFDKVWRMTKRGRPKMSAQWLEKLKEKRTDLAAIALKQPRRGFESADEKTSSSSSSSSSEESSDSEDLYEYKPDAVRDERPAVCDAVLLEMAAAREKRRAAEARAAARARARREAEKGSTKTSGEKNRAVSGTKSGSESRDSVPGETKPDGAKSPKSPKTKKRTRDVEMADA